MSNELQELYQEVIIDHSKHPRNFRKIEDATRTVEGFNPLCGDQFTLYIKLVNGVIEDIAFQGTGCAISKASASMMTSALIRKKQEEALVLFEHIHTLLTEGSCSKAELEQADELVALSSVWRFPMRVKCAILPWHILRNMLETKRIGTSMEHNYES